MSGPGLLTRHKSASGMQQVAPLVAGLEPQYADRQASAKVNACTLLSPAEQPTPAIALGGHRGMGENLVSTDESDTRPLRFRENTVHSFVRAAQAGASFVEFDVQVTADGVPVIWHDDYVITRRADGKLKHRFVAQLTLAEFKGVALPERACQSGAGSLRDAAGNLGSVEALAGRDGPVGAAEGQLVRLFHDSEGRRTRAPEPWAVEADDGLPTLAEVFEGVPESVGFDIEVKMTTPDNLPATPAAKVERMVSATLDTVERVAVYSSRTIVFTSFDPDVCRALRARQARFPVMFLSGGGEYAHADERRTSVAGAIAWALEANLQGLVLHAGAVQTQPAAVTTACWKGLQVLTYGLENNDPAWVRQQALLGVHAVIVDDVERVASALHGA